MLIRELKVTNGIDTRTLLIERIDGKIMLWDRDNDPYSDGMIELAGDTDSDVRDALADAGEWELVISDRAAE